MTTNLIPKIVLLALIGSSIFSSQAQTMNGEKILLKWKPTESYNAKDDLKLQLTIINNSNESIAIKDWELFFNAMYPALNTKGADYILNDETGNLFRVTFLKEKLLPKDSIVVLYDSKYAISNISTMPNGFYLQNKHNRDEFYPVENVSYQHIRRSKDQHKAFLSDLYDKNERLNKHIQEVQAIFPTPKSISYSKGNYELKHFAIAFDNRFSNVSEKFQQVFGEKDISIVNVAKANIFISHDANLPTEGYHLTVSKKGLTISASTDQGLYYALQSIRSLMAATNIMAATNKSSKRILPFVQIEDAPRYGYRGFMLDIARNFNNKETIKRYIEIMAAYKLNTFHLHFIDDEGWRIEIPSLPELTEVGASRSPMYTNGKSVQPAYGSGGFSVEGKFLTREDFVEILKFAKQHHITVVPEIETPGHARVAIKSMEKRYHDWMEKGNSVEAEKYLLHDFEDKSIYNSAQNWTDNVINPALPSVYTFIEQVIDEFISMYKDAGLTLTKVSIGGDEVPNGVWEQSPKIKDLMSRENLNSVYEVWTYYISKVNDICLRKGIEMAGWEEIGMVNHGNGMLQNPDLPNKHNIQVDVWNNVIGGKQEDLAYRLANAGYKTVLISASNMYFDMMWDTTFEEPGLKWATYADLYHSYSLLPEDFFANIDNYYSGKALGKAGFADRVRLNDIGRKNFIGIKGGLWAETVQSADQLDYLVFPRFFALAERAWSPKRSYESEKTFNLDQFDQDYIRFLNRVSQIELPQIADKFNFRLPGIGVKEENGFVYVNTEYAGFDVFYTIDGSNPTRDSQKYVGKPIKVQEGQNLAFAVIDNTGRSSKITYFTK